MRNVLIGVLTVLAALILGGGFALFAGGAFPILFDSRPLERPPAEAAPASDLEVAPAELVDAGQRRELADVELSECAAPSEPGAWSPEPGTPAALLPPEERAKYEPTCESLEAWVASVPELEGRGVEWNEDVRYLWGLCRQHQALRAFTIGHQERELERWRNREQSVPLWAELQPARAFLDRHVGDVEEVWSLVERYDLDVAEQIRGEGDDADRRDDVDSRWELLRALSRAGRPSFDAAVETLTGIPNR